MWKCIWVQGPCPVHFFNSKLSTETIEKCLESCQPLLWLLKSGTFVISSKFFDIIDSQDICEYSALQKNYHTIYVCVHSPHTNLYLLYFEVLCSIQLLRIGVSVPVTLWSLVNMGGAVKLMSYLNINSSCLRLIPYVLMLPDPLAPRNVSTGWQHFISTFTRNILKPFSFLTQCALMFSSLIFE